MTQTTRIGQLGLGLLGSAIAERLLKLGHEVVGCDVDPSRLDALRELGGQAESDIGKWLADCAVVLICLPDSPVTETVLPKLLASIDSPTTIVDHTTGCPNAMALMAEQCRSNGVDYLDACIVGSSTQARDGHAVLLVGGEPPAFEKCQPLLNELGRKVHHVGPAGAGARWKLVVNLVLGLNRAVLAEGLSLAAACGIDETRLLDVLCDSPAQSAVMATKGARMVNQDYSPQARLAQHHKDVRRILELGREQGAALPLSEVHEQLLQLAEDRGFGNKDNSAIRESFG